MKNNYIMREPDATGAAGGGGTAVITPPATGAATGGALTAPLTTFPADDWRSTLPADLQGDSSIKDVKTVPDLVKMHISAQKLIGAPKVAIPQENWGDKDWNEFFDKSGRPADPKGYKLTDATTIKMPEGVKEDPVAKEAFLKAFHTSGLNNKQADTLYKEYWNIQTSYINNQRAVQKEAQQKATAQLQTEWGPQYAERMEMAKMAALHFGGPEFKDWMNNNNLGDDPVFIKLFHSIGASMSEDKARGKGGGSFGASPDGAASEIKQLQSDPGFMKSYLDKREPGHKAAQDKMEALFKTAYPGKQEFSTGGAR